MVYISWSFLKMGNKSDGKASLVLLLVSIIPLALVTVLALFLSLGMVVYAWPVLLPMLLPFYLPCALRREAVTEIRSGNVLFDKTPLVVTYKPLVRNWVYAVYAVLPALALVLIGRVMPLEAARNGRNLAEFFLVWTALYSSFMILTVFLGKTAYLKLGRLLLAAASSVALVFLYALCR